MPQSHTGWYATCISSIEVWLVFKSIFSFCVYLSTTMKELKSAAIPSHPWIVKTYKKETTWQLWLFQSLHPVSTPLWVSSLKLIFPPFQFYWVFNLVRSSSIWDHWTKVKDFLFQNSLIFVIHATVSSDWCWAR